MRPKDKPLSELEKLFFETTKTTQPQIEEQLDIANKALAEAERLAEQSGVPFYSSVSRISQCYVPRSHSDKFPDLDRGFVSDAVGVYVRDYLDYGYGWEHSAVC